MKRSVQDTSFEESDQANKIFQKSKIISRSPVKENDSAEMETVLKAIHEMRQEMRVGFEESNKQNNELKKELGQTRDELKTIKEEMRNKEETWRREKKCLEDRLQQVEERLESQEREKRRNNIIIRNAKLMNGNLREETEKFLKEKLIIDAHVETAHEISNGTIIAKMTSWPQKKKVLENKRKLKGTDTYIDNDLTAHERNIQRSLRKMAKEERTKGKLVKVGYKKINIDNVEYKWRDVINEESFRNEKTNTAPKN